MLEQATGTTPGGALRTSLRAMPYGDTREPWEDWSVQTVEEGRIEYVSIPPNATVEALHVTVSSVSFHELSGTRVYLVSRQEWEKALPDAAEGRRIGTYR